MISRFVCSSTLLILLTSASGSPSPGQPAESRSNAPGWSDALPYYNLGNKYLEHERYDEAIESYHAACARYDQDPDFYINLGVAYRKIDDYASAEGAFRHALKLNDKDWMSWSNLANSLLKQKKLKETKAAFRTCLKCNPPAKEKAAIEKDIVDIDKILAASQPPLATTAPPPKSKPAGKRASTGASLSASTKSITSTKSINSAKSTTSANTTPIVVTPAVGADTADSGWSEVLGR